MKSISEYTIYCTEAQTRKALELGAPIEINDTFDSIDIKESNIFYKDKFIELSDGRLIERITSEEMIGWLETQGILVLIDPSQDKFYGTYCLKREDGYWFNRIFLEGLYPFRKEATLAAIDAALEYLANNKNV